MSKETIAFGSVPEKDKALLYSCALSILPPGPEKYRRGEGIQ